MLVIISALAVWPASTKAAATTDAVSLLRRDMVPPEAFPVKLSETALLSLAEAAHGAKPAAAHYRRAACLTERSTVARPWLNVKQRKSSLLDDRVHGRGGRAGEELPHRALQPVALQIAGDEDDPGPAPLPVPPRQQGGRMEQMLNTVHRHRLVGPGDI